MNTVDLSPFYRNSIGFDRIASLINSALASEQTGQGYPPYNIEVLDENKYAITLAVAGFTLEELNIVSERGVLSVKGIKSDKQKRQYLHQGIANRNFERKFNLADHVEIVEADLQNGMLTINLVRVIPETLKPKTIAIKANALGTANQAQLESDQDYKSA